jgi:hypothetical protein
MSTKHAIVLLSSEIRTRASILNLHHARNSTLQFADGEYTILKESVALELNQQTCLLQVRWLYGRQHGASRTILTMPEWVECEGNEGDTDYDLLLWFETRRKQILADSHRAYVARFHHQLALCGCTDVCSIIRSYLDAFHYNPAHENTSENPYCNVLSDDRVAMIRECASTSQATVTRVDDALNNESFTLHFNAFSTATLSLGTIISGNSL